MAGVNFRGGETIRRRHGLKKYSYFLERHDAVVEIVACACREREISAMRRAALATAAERSEAASSRRNRIHRNFTESGI